MSNRNKVLLLIGAVVLTMVCFEVVFLLLDRTFKEAVTPGISKSFSVLALTPGKVEVVSYGELDDYVRRNPDYSFLIPEDREAALREELIKCCSNSNGSWTFRVKRISDNRQFIELEFVKDGAYVSWYEAADKAVSPKYVKSYGPGFIFLVLQWVCPLTTVIWIAVFIIIGRSRKH